MMYYDEVRL